MVRSISNGHGSQWVWGPYLPPSHAQAPLVHTRPSLGTTKGLGESYIGFQLPAPHSVLLALFLVACASWPVPRGLSFVASPPWLLLFSLLCPGRPPPSAPTTDVLCLPQGPPSLSPI